MTAPDERDDMRARAASLSLAALDHDEVIELYGTLERAASSRVHRDHHRDDHGPIGGQIRRRCNGPDGAL